MYTFQIHELSRSVHPRLRKAAEMRQEVLKESSEARKLGVALKKHVEYSDQLVTEMFDHSRTMEKLYETFVKMLEQPDVKDSKFMKLISLAESKQKWFTNNKAGHTMFFATACHAFIEPSLQGAARAMLTSLSKGSKKKAKAKAKP